MRRGYRALAAAVVIAVACGCPARKTTPLVAPPSAEPEPLRLVVLVVVDQLPSWSFARDADAAVFEGGIARLLGEGVFYPRVELPYANTHTATGHAALATGASPAVSGILANGWYVRGPKWLVSAVVDPDYPIFQIAPRANDGGWGKGGRVYGASARRLLVEGIADVLRRETADRARVISVGIKDRAAILVAGKRAHLAIWYEADQAAMTSSAYYARTPPEWLRDLAQRAPVAARLNAVWEPLDADLLARVTGVGDDAPGESGWYGLGTTFPHALAEARAPAGAIKATPFATEMVLEAARAAMDAENIGDDEVTDLLALTFGNHDTAGHAWGQESWERLDLILRLDRDLGAFFTFLDERVGRERYAVVFTSDHGATPMVEHSRASGKPAHRLLIPEVVAELNRAAAQLVGPGDWVADGSASTLYLSKAAHALPDARRGELLDLLTQTVADIPGIGFAKRADELRGNCDQRRGIEALACRSLHPERSGEIFYTPAPGSILSRDQQHGTAHGSPSEYDRFVPLIVAVPGVGPRRVSAPVTNLQVAPTLATLLGVSAPAAATAPPLAEIRR